VRDILSIKRDNADIYLDLINKLKKAKLPIEENPCEVNLDENIDL